MQGTPAGPTATAPKSKAFDNDDHESVLNLIHEYLNNELDENSANAVRLHLAVCESCLDRFDIEEATAELTRNAELTAFLPTFVYR